MKNRLDLTGRVGVVTGASRGIGWAVANVLAAHGMKLIVCGSGAGTSIGAIASMLKAEFAVEVDSVSGDIADPATSAALAKTAFTRHRRLDLWVNNAGVLIDGLIGMVSASDVERTLMVNLAGIIHGTQSAARLMVRSGGGSIVNMSSIIGRVGNEGQLVYGASKAGVIGATLSAAKELAPRNIRVNAVAPGFVRTDMVNQLPPDKFDERVASIRMGRIGEPGDVADTVLYLASDLSCYVTGQVIGVDGGMMI